MKRLAWLLLFAFGTLLAQVPVVEPVNPAGHCACGADCDGQCGMPDCALPPAQAQWTGEAAAIAAFPAPARKAVAVRRTPARFYAAFVPPAARLIDLRTPVSWVPAARVPLFAEHCSFLL